MGRGGGGGTCPLSQQHPTLQRGAPQKHVPQQNGAEVVHRRGGVRASAPHPSHVCPPQPTCLILKGVNLSWGVKALDSLRSSGDDTVWRRSWFSFCLKRGTKKRSRSASPRPDGRTADGLRPILAHTRARAILLQGSLNSPVSPVSFVPSKLSRPERSMARRHPACCCGISSPA